jgi:hypothetical protein
LRNCSLSQRKKPRTRATAHGRGIAYRQRPVIWPLDKQKLIQAIVCDA